MTNPARYEGTERREVLCETCKVNPDWEANIKTLNEKNAGDTREKNIIRAVVGAFLTFITAIVFTYKADMEDKNATFRSEIVARQNEHKLQMTERQNSAERANEARSSVFALQVEAISGKVGEMATTVQVIAKLFERAQEQEKVDRARADAIILRLEEKVDNKVKK